MGDAIPADALDRAAHMFRLLVDASRLAIIHRLMAGGEASVGPVAEASGRGQSYTSKHLKFLAGADILARCKDGLQVFYRLSDPVVAKVCRLVLRSRRRGTNG